ncbi:hypothetical protein LJB42_002108 [Komagataella kurtzmanii]|nr:hypothetical protein LJB42_002108 [Komagataella kurtzmanii]
MNICRNRMSTMLPLFRAQRRNYSFWGKLPWKSHATPSPPTNPGNPAVMDKAARIRAKRNHDLTNVYHVREEKQPKKDLSIFYFEYGYSSYSHHSRGKRIPMISSLSDLSDGGNLAALLPKRRPPGSPINTLSIRSGDDAMLVSPTLLGLADGVSSWSDLEEGEDADAGLWARAMLETTSRFVIQHQNSVWPHDINEREIEQILDDSFFHSTDLMDLDNCHGSSTFIMALLSYSGKLNVVSIGDSKIFVFRDGKIVFKNEEQMTSPLCPVQIGTNDLRHLPSAKCWYKTFELQQDDLIVMCSDGVTDNLWEKELEQLVAQKYFKEGQNVRQLANSILKESREVAFDNFAITPYVEKINDVSSNKGAKDNFIMGGKVDDISVCVARVVNK